MLEPKSAYLGVTHFSIFADTTMYRGTALHRGSRLPKNKKKRQKWRNAENYYSAIRRSVSSGKNMLFEEIVHLNKAGIASRM